MRHNVPLILLLALFAGCTADATLKIPSNPLTRNSPKSPARLVDVWNTYAQTDPQGGRPIRGLAGRILFYPEGNAKQSIKVNGRLTVFLFDGDETDPKHAKPLRQYVFPAETLPTHYCRKDPVGHGYDFYLPFDGIDGEERTLCVLTRFDDAVKGQLVLSQPVITVLQGTKPEPRLPEGMRENPEMLARSGSARSGSDHGGSGHGESDLNSTYPEALEQEVQRLNAELDRMRRAELDRRTVATIGLPERFVRKTDDFARTAALPSEISGRFGADNGPGTAPDETGQAGDGEPNAESPGRYTAFGRDAHLAASATGKSDISPPSTSEAANTLIARRETEPTYPVATYPVPAYPVTAFPPSPFPSRTQPPDVKRDPVNHGVPPTGLPQR